MADGGGTGHQNISAQFDYGLSDFSLLSIYLSETDDPLYSSIDGEYPKLLGKYRAWL